MAAGEESGCCCYTGTKCTCGIKKEPLTLKLDTNFQKHIQQANRSKPRLTSTQSDTQLTVFANGHHKPCHRLNNAAHTSGAPYKIPRHNTLNGPSSGYHSHSGSLGHYPGVAAHRSPEEFGVSEPSSFHQYSASVDSLSLSTLPEADGRSETTGIFYSQPPSNCGAASDRSSPVDVQSADAFGFSQWPWTAGTQMSQPATTYSLDALSTSPTAADYLPNFDNDFAIPSAGLNPAPLWSAGDLPLDTGRLGKAMTPPSLGGESTRPSVPGLTSGSSGAQSEAGDPICLAESDIMNPQSGLAEQYLFDDLLALRRTERPNGYRVNAVTKWPDFRQPPTSVPTSEATTSAGTQQMMYREASPIIDTGRPYSASVGMDARPMMYTTSGVDYKPAVYPTLNAATRSMTMPSSPANNYAELSSWPSSLSLNGGFEMQQEDYKYNNAVDLTTFQYMS